MKNGLKYFSKRCDKLYCYGIGNWGRLVAKYCKIKCITIEGFIVSNDKDFDDNIFMGKPVKRIRDISINRNDAIIIATTIDKNKKEMIKEMENISHEKCYFLDPDSSVLHYYKKKYRKKVLKRKGCSIFDYEKLYRSVSMHAECWPSYADICSVLTYGIGKTVKKLVRYKCYDINGCIIAHSASFVPPDLSWTRPYDGNIFSFSSEQWENIPNVNLYVIGPVIRYVKPTFTKTRIRNLKERFGRTLLVFPAHGTSSGAAQYDYESFIKEIKRIKEIGKYRTVITCIYYQDFYFGMHKLYQSEGYKIVTAGHEFDGNFLRRLKSLLMISDMVMSSGDGTQIGYAIALGIPAYCFKMDIYHPDNEKYNNGERIVFGNENALDVSSKIHHEIISHFSVYKECITMDQIKVVQKYWGDWECRKKIRRIKHIDVR